MRFDLASSGSHILAPLGILQTIQRNSSTIFMENAFFVCASTFSNMPPLAAFTADPPSSTVVGSVVFCLAGSALFVTRIPGLPSR